MTYSVTVKRLDVDPFGEDAALAEPPRVFVEELAKACGHADKTITYRARVAEQLTKGGSVTGRLTGAMFAMIVFEITATWDRGAEIIEVWATAGRLLGEQINPPKKKPATTVRTDKPREGKTRKVVDAANPMNPERWTVTLDCGHSQWITQKGRPPRGKKVVCTQCVDGVEDAAK